MDSNLSDFLLSDDFVFALNGFDKKQVCVLVLMSLIEQFSSRKMERLVYRSTLKHKPIQEKEQEAQLMLTNPRDALRD